MKKYIEMKSVLKFLLLFLFVLPFQACSDDETFLPEDLKQLPVTSYNLSGVWKLKCWNGSEEQVPVVYLELISRGYKFNLYQWFSMYPSLKTGVYSLDNSDYYKGDVIKGKYDHDSGPWNNDYIVTLYANKLVLVSDDENREVQEFVRVDEVPADIKDSALSPVSAEE